MGHQSAQISTQLKWYSYSIEWDTKVRKSVHIIHICYSNSIEWDIKVRKSQHSLNAIGRMVDTRYLVSNGTPKCALSYKIYGKISQI